MKPLYIGVNIDWSKSFVDENGAFYCGTTKEQKELAARMMPACNMVIYTTDFHSINSKEFAVNGGMWPYHNVAEFRDIDVRELGLKDNTCISPEQTEIIDDRIDKTISGIMVPKHVYFQDGKDRSFSPEMVEEALNDKIITAKEFMEGDYNYIISPKIHFDGSTTISDLRLPESYDQRIPDMDYTVFDLISLKYADRDVVYLGTGVVDNICRHCTSIGVKQRFPESRFVNIIGATTPYQGTGFKNNKEVKEACEGIQKNMGVEHKTIEEVFEELGRK